MHHILDIHSLFIDRGKTALEYGHRTDVRRSSLLVGAPRDHVPHDVIARRGTVWKCDFQADHQCQRLPFRRDGTRDERKETSPSDAASFLGEANVRVGTSFDNKTDQWLGASLAANDANIIVSRALMLKFTEYDFSSR